MPIISRHKCNKCSFQMASGWGCYTYAVNKWGWRVVCGHPGEVSKVREVTGMSHGEALAAGRTGRADRCVCLDCLKQFDLDFNRDPLVCPRCDSSLIRSTSQLIGQPCPKCKEGTFECDPFIRPKLDADWEQLPVPQIVKDLVEYEDTRNVPASLEAAFNAAKNPDGAGFVTTALTLLNLLEARDAWWFTSRKKRDSRELVPQGHWCQTLPEVLKVTPALAELFVIRGDRVWVREEVDSETRRGIKNYIGKHMKRFIMC